MDISISTVAVECLWMYVIKSQKHTNTNAYLQVCFELCWKVSGLNASPDPYDDIIAWLAVDSLSFEYILCHKFE